MTWIFPRYVSEYTIYPLLRAVFCQWINSDRIFYYSQIYKFPMYFVSKKFFNSILVNNSISYEKPTLKFNSIMFAFADRDELVPSTRGPRQAMPGAEHIGDGLQSCRLQRLVSIEKKTRGVYKSNSSTAHKTSTRSGNRPQV